jgi:hypothetical protein
MVAICVPVTSWHQYERYALPGINRVLEAAPETLLVARESTGSYQRTVNAMLEELADHEGLEAVVIIHQDIELMDTNVAAILPDCFADGRVAIVGTIGGRGRSGLTWGSFAPRGARVEVPPANDAEDYGGGFGLVSSVDGVLIALSPWAIRNLRFDLRFEQWFHGYDMDICLQARAHGKLVAVADLPVRHFQLDPFHDGRGETWIAADIEIRRKWDLPRASTGLDWTRGPDPHKPWLG